MHFGQPLPDALLDLRVANSALCVEQDQVRTQVEEVGTKVKRTVDRVINRQPVFQTFREHVGPDDIGSCRSVHQIPKARLDAASLLISTES